MNPRITFNEPVWMRWLKLLYLVPVAIILYPVTVIWSGILRAGNPFEGFTEINRPRRRKSCDDNESQ